MTQTQTPVRAVAEADRPALARTFCVGYMHSGTTLLLRILSNHPDVLGAGRESKYFMMVAEVREAFPDLSRSRHAEDLALYLVVLLEGTAKIKDFGWNPGRVVDEHSFSDHDRERARRLALEVQGHTHGEAFRIVFDALARDAGKSQWLEKTPTHVYHIDKIVRAVPEARFVEIVRDPRDVIASKKTRREAIWTSDRYKGQEQYKSWEKAYDPIWDTISWRTAIQAGLRARERYGSRVHTIRYRDLVRDPETVVRGICDFLDLGYDAGMLDLDHRNSADAGITRTGISDDAVGRWQRVLGSGEVAACQLVGREAMGTHGFEVKPQPLGARVAVARYVGGAGVEIWRRLYSRWRMGGFGFVRNVLRGYVHRGRQLVGGGS
ncbi:MAG: sulfotransferase [Bacteroidota bacterium]